MLTIICGEDNVESRNYFLTLKENFRKKGYEIQNVNSLEIDDVPSLFAQKRIYFIENLNKKINKKNLKITRNIKNIIENKEIEIVDWEDQISARELKITGAAVKEFKPAQNIFKLIDTCYPGNMTNFLKILHEMPPKIEEGFIYIMLTRHIRNLLLVKSGTGNAKLSPWQEAKLRNQARFWTTEQLIAFYDGLFRIDVSSKTGNNPFSYTKSLDILTQYFL